MAKKLYNGPETFRPIGAWAYVGYTVLFMIPVLGFVLTLVFACSSANINRRNYARSILCWWLIGLIFFGSLIFMAFRSGELREWLKNNVPQAENVLHSFEEKTGNLASSTGKAVQEASPDPAPTAEASKQPASTPEPSAAANALIREDVKEAIDGCEAFFREYAEFMKKYNSTSNPVVLATEYVRMMNLYAENEKKWASFEKEHELNDAEELYLSAAAIRIQQILLEAEIAIENK